LTRARKIITPHAEIAAIFQNKVEKLEWHISNTENRSITGTKVLFPASAVGRKGAYEMKRLAKELQLDLVIAGRSIEQENFWEDVPIETFTGNFHDIGLVVYPTYVEHQPRQLLKALSKGIPVVTTTASGLEPSECVDIVETTNFEQLKEVVRKRMALLKQEPLSNE
jgi:hypothetical protein